PPPPPPSPYTTLFRSKTATERCKNPATKRTKPQPHLPMPGDPTQEDRRAPWSAWKTSAVLESTQDVRQQNHGICGDAGGGPVGLDRKSTRLNSSHVSI